MHITFTSTRVLVLVLVQVPGGQLFNFTIYINTVLKVTNKTKWNN